MTLTDAQKKQVKNTVKYIQDGTLKAEVFFANENIPVEVRNAVAKKVGNKPVQVATAPRLSVWNDRVYINHRDLEAAGVKAFYTNAGDDFASVTIQGGFTVHGRKQAEALAAEIADKHGRSFAKIVVAAK
jgi:hypothetical protein